MKDLRTIGMLLVTLLGLGAIGLIFWLILSALAWALGHVAQIMPWVYGGLAIIGFVIALHIADLLITVHGKHHKNKVLHADPQRLVLLEGSMFRRYPRVYHTQTLTPARSVIEVEEEDVPQIEPPRIKQPSMRILMDELEEGGLQVSPGIRADTGEPVILSIEDAVHFKLIGASGFGKSCLAAALLDQAVTLNSPDLLQVALLDLEHKTSRLFENSPNVAIFQVGQRRISMVATNADEVATYLGYLKSELDRRATLSERDLEGKPILLMYVEEMLSLQYEVDEKLLSRMLADLSVLAVRARKYRMFLLACAQTDYSTPALKTAQKQFRTRMAFAIDTTAARAAGFMSTTLIKENFTQSEKGGGQFVLESPGIASLMLAPVYDVRKKLLMRERSASVQEPFNARSIPVLENDTELALQAKGAKVQELRAMQWGKGAIIEKVWGAKKGANKAYLAAEIEYENIIRESESDD